MDEITIIQKVLSGDTNEYRLLVERYHAGLIIHCERIVGDRDEAEDIAQEAFVKAFTHLGNYQPERSRFSTWLYKIATNQALDYLRVRKRQINTDDIEALAEATMPTVLADEERREIHKAVSELVPPEYRKVIEAYYWQGKNYQQIADELHTPINTVRTWMRRAKLQLKGRLS